MSDSDYLILEDESGRVRLDLSRMSFEAQKNYFSVSGLVSGVVVAVKGRQGASNFVVTDILTADLAPQNPLPVTSSDAPPQYVLFVSGLMFGHPDCDPLPVQMLVDYISGKCILCKACPLSFSLAPNRR